MGRRIRRALNVFRRRRSSSSSNNVVAEALAPSTSVSPLAKAVAPTPAPTPAPAPSPAPAITPAPVPKVEEVQAEEKQTVDTARQNAMTAVEAKKTDTTDVGLGDVQLDFSNAITNPFGRKEEDDLKKALKGG